MPWIRIRMYPQDSIGHSYNPGKFGVKTLKQVDQLLSVYTYINYHTNTHAHTHTDNTHYKLYIHMQWINTLHVNYIMIYTYCTCTW